MPSESDRLDRWLRYWKRHWERQEAADFELRTTGAARPWRDPERRLLTRERTPDEDRQSVDRIAREFARGFRALRGLGPTVTVFGSARFGPRHHYYKLGRELGAELARAGFTVMTGGGPGVMEAANRGAHEAGGTSIGCNIKLPMEQQPNPYLDRFVELDHFFIRKVLLVRYSCAFVVLPGGFGTLDELFEAATLIQTGKIGPFAVVVLDRPYWARLADFLRHTVEAGAVGASEIDFALGVDTPADAVDAIEASLPPDTRADLDVRAMRFRRQAAAKTARRASAAGTGAKKARRRKASRRRA